MSDVSAVLASAIEKAELELKREMTKLELGIFKKGWREGALYGIGEAKKIYVEDK